MKVLFFIFLLVLAVAGMVDPVFAAGPNSRFTYDSLVGVVVNLSEFLIQIAGLTVIGTIVYFGVRMVLAGSDATAFANARKGLMWALIGALVIFGVWTIMATIQGAVERLGR